MALMVTQGHVNEMLIFFLLKHFFQTLMQAIVMVHRMQRMTMFASNISKNPPSAAVGADTGQSAAGENLDNTNTLSLSTIPEKSASVPPNSPFPSSPKNANKVASGHSSANVNPTITASTNAPTPTSSKAPSSVSTPVATSSNN